MKYAASPKPVLGPCPCRDCGEPLYWARRLTTVLNVTVGSLRWRDWKSHLHQCDHLARQRRFNGRVGVTTARGVVRRKSQIRHESVHHGHGS